MTNLASIKEALAKAMGALDGDNGGALRLVDKAIEACNELGDLLDASDAFRNVWSLRK